MVRYLERRGSGESFAVVCTYDTAHEGGRPEALAQQHLIAEGLFPHRHSHTRCARSILHARS